MGARRSQIQNQPGLRGKTLSEGRRGKEGRTVHTFILLRVKSFHNHIEAGIIGCLGKRAYGQGVLNPF